MNGQNQKNTSVQNVCWQQNTSKASVCDVMLRLFAAAHKMWFQFSCWKVYFINYPCLFVWMLSPFQPRLALAGSIEAAYVLII